MWHKFRFHFNSSALTAFFLMTAVGFIILLIAIWNVSVRAEKVANLQHDERMIIGGISASILGSAQLDISGLQQQSQVLIQDYLNLTFGEEKNNPQAKNFARVAIYLIGADSQQDQMKQLVGEWSSDSEVPRECLEHRTEYVQPPRSQLNYQVDLYVNTCSANFLSLMEYHTLSTPILVALSVILIWGICIYAMLHSVSYAGNLLESSEDVSEVLQSVKEIKWTNVENLAQKALQVRGRNLQYYQTLVLDAQHDIAKVLDFISRKYSNKELNHNISIVRGIIQTLATEVRSSDKPYQDVTGHREITTEELVKLIQIYFVGVNLKNELPPHFSFHVSDISIFERLLVNLASNAVKHGIDTPTLRVFYENKAFQLRVYTPISDFSVLKMHFAKLTNRIDVKNPETPVYVKIFGRTGRGLSIIKRGVFKLGGYMIFRVVKNMVETGFILPATFEEKIPPPTAVLKTTKKRVIVFRNEEFKNMARAHGLESFLKEESELQDVIKEGSPLELVSDFDVSLSSPSTVRIISKKERIEGIALNWLGKRDSE